jgi:SM-20-related protein
MRAMSGPTGERKIFLPAYQVRRDFLPAALADGLLAFAIAHEDKFVPSAANSPDGPRVDPNWRISMELSDLGPFNAELRAHVMPLADGLMRALHIDPFEPAGAELSLVAHGDGAFLTRHVDFLRRGTATTMRMLSGVYYFHRRPKAFEGGALRLYEIVPRGRDTRHIDVAPEHNSMAFFGAFVPHEVLPVRVPSGRFEDSRFAINFWIHRTKPEGA